MSNGTPASISGNAYLGGGSPWLVGSSSTSLVSFYGAAPVAQPTKPVAVVTTAPALSSYGFTYAQAAAIITAINTGITALTTLGLWA